MPLAITNHFTAVVKGGKLRLNVRRWYIKSRSPRSSYSTLVMVAGHRSGCGTTGKLLCPTWSTARTAKITLSFETGTVSFVAFLTVCECCQSGADVSRHTTSYEVARPSAGASHRSVESFTSSLVTRRTFCGGAGAAASDANVAAFTRATPAT